MQRIWNVKNKLENIELENKNKFHQVVLQLLLNRGIVKAEELEKFFSLSYDTDVHDPFLFSDMEKAVERIIQAKKNLEKIAIFGDYDADGVTATALLYEALTGLGFEKIIPYIPDRQTEGYGMNELAMEFLAKEGVNLVVTVDCGITNITEVEKARSLGIDVVITDHHHVPKKLPDAVAIINPHVENCGYPFENLAGVGVAFKLAQALYKK